MFTVKLEEIRNHLGDKELEINISDGRKGNMIGIVKLGQEWNLCVNISEIMLIAPLEECFTTKKLIK